MKPGDELFGKGETPKPDDKPKGGNLASGAKAATSTKPTPVKPLNKGPFDAASQSAQTVKKNDPGDLEKTLKEIQEGRLTGLVVPVKKLMEHGGIKTLAAHIHEVKGLTTEQAIKALMDNKGGIDELKKFKSAKGDTLSKEDREQIDRAISDCIAKKLQTGIKGIDAVDLIFKAAGIRGLLEHVDSITDMTVKEAISFLISNKADTSILEEYAEEHGKKPRKSTETPEARTADLALIGSAIDKMKSAKKDKEAEEFIKKNAPKKDDDIEAFIEQLIAINGVSALNKYYAEQKRIHTLLNKESNEVNKNKKIYEKHKETQKTNKTTIDKLKEENATGKMNLAEVDTAFVKTLEKTPPASESANDAPPPLDAPDFPGPPPEIPDFLGPPPAMPGAAQGYIAQKKPSSSKPSPEPVAAGDATPSQPSGMGSMAEAAAGMAKQHLKKSTEPRKVRVKSEEEILEEAKTNIREKHDTNRKLIQAIREAGIYTDELITAEEAVTKTQKTEIEQLRGQKAQIAEFQGQNTATREGLENLTGVVKDPTKTEEVGSGPEAPDFGPPPLDESLLGAKSTSTSPSKTSSKTKTEGETPNGAPPADNKEQKAAMADEMSRALAARNAAAAVSDPDAIRLLVEDLVKDDPLLIKFLNTKYPGEVNSTKDKIMQQIEETFAAAGKIEAYKTISRSFGSSTSLKEKIKKIQSQIPILLSQALDNFYNDLSETRQSEIKKYYQSAEKKARDEKEAAEKAEKDRLAKEAEDKAVAESTARKEALKDILEEPGQAEALKKQELMQQTQNNLRVLEKDLEKSNSFAEIIEAEQAGIVKLTSAFQTITASITVQLPGDVKERIDGMRAEITTKLGGLAETVKAIEPPKENIESKPAEPQATAPTVPAVTFTTAAPKIEEKTKETSKTVAATKLPLKEATPVVFSGPGKDVVVPGSSAATQKTMATTKEGSKNSITEKHWQEITETVRAEAKKNEDQVRRADGERITLLTKKAAEINIRNKGDEVTVSSNKKDYKALVANYKITAAVLKKDDCCIDMSPTPEDTMELILELTKEPQKITPVINKGSIEKALRDKAKEAGPSSRYKEALDTYDRLKTEREAILRRAAESTNKKSPIG